MRYAYTKDTNGLVRRIGSRFTNVTAAIVLAVTSIGGTLPLVLAGNAHAAPACTTVCINEIHPSTTDSNRWVELYNPTASSVSLKSWCITHDGGKGNFGGVFGDVSIPSDGFYVQYVGSSTTNNASLPASSDTLRLSEGANGPEADSVTYPTLAEGESYGRSPDGSGTFMVFTSSEVTEGAKNYVAPTPDPSVTPQEFTTISDTANYYKGVDVGFKLSPNFGTLTSLTVSLYDSTGLIGTNTAAQPMLAYYNSSTGSDFTSPFVIQPGAYNPATDTYWHFPASYNWNENELPTKVVINAVGTSATESATNSSFSEAGGSFASLFPAPAAGPVYDQTTKTYYPTIQAAVNAAGNNDTIIASADTYAENVTINKPLTIEGANAGLAGNNNSRGAESVASGTWSVESGNVTIDGFKFEDSGTAVYVIAQNNVTLENNIVVKAANSYIDGFEENSGVADNLTITGNYFLNGDSGQGNNADISFIGTPTQVSHGLAISGNTSTNGATFVNIGNVSGASITGNTVSSASGSAIYFAGNDVGTSITGNSITGGAGAAINVSNYFYGPSFYTTIKNNDLSGNTNGIKAPANSTNANAIPNVQQNWWGSANGPADTNTKDGSAPASNSYGKGSPAIGDVAYGPWCTDQACTTFSNATPATPTSLFFSANNKDYQSGYATSKSYTGGAMNLHWTANTPNSLVGAYRIERTYPNGQVSTYTILPGNSTPLYNFTKEGQGWYKYRVQTESLSGGNWSAWSDQVKIGYDTQAPTVSFSSPAGSSLNTTKPFTISGTYTEHGVSGISRIQLYISKGNQYNYNTHVGYLTASLPNKPAPPADGATGTFTYTLSQQQVDQLASKLGIADTDQLTITAVAIDNAGNGATSGNNWKNSSITLTADNTLPTVKVNLDRKSYLTNGGTTGKVQNPEIEAYDTNLTEIQILDQNGKEVTHWDSVTPGTVTRKNISWLGNGTYTIYAYDAAGNQSIAFTLTIDNTPPAVPTNLSWLDANGNPATNGYTNVQTGNLSWQDPDTSVDHYVYDFWTNIPGYYDGQANAWTTDSSNYITTNPGTGGSIGTNFYNKEGTYYFCVEAVDAVGNTSTCSNTYSLVYDATPPVATIDGVNPSGKTFDGSTNINVHVTDTNYQQTDIYGVGNSFHQTYKAPGTWFGLFWLKNGDYKMVVSDKAGNSTTYYFTIKRNDPTITFLNPTRFNDPSYNQYFNNIGSLEINATGDNVAIASTVIHIYDANGTPSSAWCGAAVMSATASCDASGLAEGNYYVKVAATDKDGNSSYLTKYFTIDKTPPAAPASVSWETPSGTVLTSPAFTNASGGTATWSTSTSSDVAYYIYNYWNNIATSQYNSQTKAWTNNVNGTSYSGVFNQGQGENYFCVIAVDYAGNQSSCSPTFTITYDTTPPATPTASPAGGTYTSAQSVKLSDTDATATIYYTTDGSTPTTASQKYTSAIAVSSSETIKAIAVDQAGNTSTTPMSETYTITPPAPLTFTATTLTGGRGAAGTTGTNGGTTGTNPGNVLGASTTTPSTNNQGQIKGDSTTKPLATNASTASDSGFNYNWLWLLLLLLIPIVYYAAKKKADNSD